MNNRRVRMFICTFIRNGWFMHDAVYTRRRRRQKEGMFWSLLMTLLKMVSVLQKVASLSRLT